MTYREERADRGTNWAWWIIAALGAAAIVFLIWLLIGGNEGPEAGVTTDDLTEDDGQAFVGRQVTVSESITDIISANAFTIGGGDFLGGENLLVVGAEGAFPVPLAVDPADAEGLGEDEVLEEDDVVQVTGTVRMFVIAEVEDEIGLDLDDDLYVDFEGETVLVASEVDMTPEEDEANEPVADATIDEIVEDPDVYVGDDVTVSGSVNQELDEFGFRLGGEDFLEGEGLLVVSADTQAISDLTESEEELVAQVQGTVQIFDLVTVEEDLGVDLDDDVYSEFDGEPVVIASDIQVVPASE